MHTHIYQCCKDWYTPRNFQESHWHYIYRHLIPEDIKDSSDEETSPDESFLHLQPENQYSKRNSEHRQDACRSSSLPGHPDSTENEYTCQKMYLRNYTPQQLYHEYDCLNQTEYTGNENPANLHQRIGHCPEKPDGKAGHHRYHISDATQSHHDGLRYAKYPYHRLSHFWSHHQRRQNVRQTGIRNCPKIFRQAPALFFRNGWYIHR